MWVYNLSMQVILENPPNIDDIKKVFTINDTTVFTYGDIIYNPNNCPLDIPIRAHEELHSRQQGDDPEGWWRKYLDNVEFRMEQELAAYQVQFWMQCRIIKNRDVRALNLQKLAETFGGGMYGAMIPLSEAKRLISWKPKKKK